MRGTVFWLGAAGFVVLAVMRISDPLLPMVAEEFGRTIGECAIIISAFALPYGVFQVFYGPMGDRFGKLRVISVTLGIGGLLTCATSLASGIGSLAVMRLLAGSTLAASVPLSIAYIGDNVAYAERQPVLGRYLSGTIIGIVFGSAVAGYIGEHYGWRMIFLVFGATTCAVSAVVFIIAGSHSEPTAHVPIFSRNMLMPYFRLLRDVRVRQIVLTGFVEGMVLFSGIAYFGAFLRDTFTLDYALIGILTGIFGIGGLVYIAVITTAVRLLSERGRIMGGGLLAASSYASLGLLPSWGWVAPVLLIFGFGFYLLHNTMQTLATEMSVAQRGTAVSLFVFALFSGLSLGSAGIGTVVDLIGYGPTFALLGLVLMLMCTWLTVQFEFEPERVS